VDQHSSVARLYVPANARFLPFSYKRAFRIWFNRGFGLISVAFLLFTLFELFTDPDWFWGLFVGLYVAVILADWTRAKWQARWEQFWKDYNGREFR
jgi:hypothetical protein